MEGKTTEPLTMSVPMDMLFNIYLALYDAYERLETGSIQQKRCIDYLESNHGFKPPSSYITKEQKDFVEMKEREDKLRKPWMIGGVNPEQ